MKKNVLLFGAGKSATTLISYLLFQSDKIQFTFTVADVNKTLIEKKTKNHNNSIAVATDISDGAKRKELIRAADVVISMMPPTLHILIAKDCLAEGKHLLTASYADDEMKTLHQEAQQKGLLFLCEMGLDPGIDHMSAMKLIDEIHAEGGEITSFKSHCGGLVAPESDNNPWHYKISWNPRNVVLAGKAGAVYLEGGDEKTVPYEHLFTTQHSIDTGDETIGKLCWYPNRNSLPYIELYNLLHIKDFVRTTLRYPEFMDGWGKMVKLNFTDETPACQSDGMSLKSFYNNHLQYHNQDEVKNALTAKFKEQLVCLGAADDNTTIDKGLCSAADVLQLAMEKNLALQPGDKDLVVMVHEIDYHIHGQKKHVTSSLILRGDDDMETAMSKTVGLPLAMGTLLILEDKIPVRGVHIPTLQQIYTQVLPLLENEGVKFHEVFS